MYGKKIRELRSASGLSQKDLAEKINVSQTNISFWEKSIYPPLEAIEKICSAMNIKVWEFFIDETVFEKLRKIPSHVSKQDMENLRILNTMVSADNRVIAKEMFANILELALRASGQGVK